MLDDLRNSALQSIEEESPPEEDAANPHGLERGMFLGMSAPQRFVIALLLLFMACVLAGFFLLLTERMVLPIY